MEPAFDLIIREFMNGAWFIFSMLLAVFFAYYLYDQWRRRPLSWNFGKYRGVPRIQVATALLVVFSAETMRAGWIWYILKRQNDGASVAFATSLWPVGLVASIILAVGALCVIRVFSRAQAGHKAWLTALGAALIFLGLAEIW